MATLSDFIEYLLRLEPQKNQPRLAFYHYLKNFETLTKPLESSILSRFARRALLYSQWQQDRENLLQVLEQDITSYGREFESPLKLAEFTKILTAQILTVERPEELRAIIQGQKGQPSSQTRCLNYDSKQVLSLGKDEADQLRVDIYSPYCLLLNGGLQPLAPITSLTYSPTLDLAEEKLQILELSPGVVSLFSIGGQCCKGAVLRSHTFNKFETLKSRLPQQPQLFYALKYIEGHFVNPNSDPLYKELVSLLERAGALMQEMRPEAQSLAQEALKRGRQAVRNVFPHDKLLLLLVTNLEYQLNQKEAWQRPLNNLESV